MQDPKNEAGKKDLWHPGKRDGKVLKEEVVKNTAEDTTSMGDIDAARFRVDIFQRSLDSALYRHYEYKEMYMFNGNVTLLDVVPSKQAEDHLISLTQGVKAVKSVTSKLTIQK